MTVAAQHHLDIVELHWQQVSAQRVLPGFHRTTPHIRLLDTMDALVASINAYVLEDQGGEPVSNSLTVTRKVRPWWIPKWLWARIDNETRTVSVTAHPKWIYPMATVRVPDLKPAVRFVAREASLGEWR